ncbi:hypothetical protein GobsT_37970 [Gemmata obscuriglobus]|nr:hypothetical protein GobsT_37970 [Gemmata obscuriglobus]VTS07591.1 unnamed protein product [Gemmata obscuriglobus UQM 2246]
MNTSNPIGNRSEPEAADDEPGQDESGRTAAPLSEPGPKTNRRERRAKREDDAKAPTKSNTADDDADEGT